MSLLAPEVLHVTNGEILTGLRAAWVYDFLKTCACRLGPPPAAAHPPREGGVVGQVPGRGARQLPPGVVETSVLNLWSLRADGPFSPGHKLV
jgi:hypothetical protein